MEKVFGKPNTIKYIDNKGKVHVIIGKKQKSFDIKLTKQPVDKTIKQTIKQRDKVQDDLNSQTGKLQKIFIKNLNKKNNNTNKSQVVKEIGQLTNQIETYDYTIRQLRDYSYTHKNRIVRTIQF